MMMLRVLVRRPRFSAVALVKALPTQARDHNPVSSQETVVTLSHPVLARGVVEALHHEVHDKLLANGYFNVSAERRTRSLWPLCRPKSWGPQVFPNKARCWEPAGRDAARQFTVADFRNWMWRYNLTTPAHLLLTDPSAAQSCIC